MRRSAREEAETPVATRRRVRARRRRSAAALPTAKNAAALEKDLKKAEAASPNLARANEAEAASARLGEDIRRLEERLDTRDAEDGPDPESESGRRLEDPPP